MIKELRLNNIILIESAHIPFGMGFNVLSGESGSGKSAIINALNLIAGDRCDQGILRRGSEKAVVEAIFELNNSEILSTLLNDSGIDHEPNGELFIRRELSISGKSRAFINNQLAQLSLLRQVSALLFDIIGQHANQKLLSLDYHREAIDLFGNLQPHVNEFAKSWNEESRIRQTLEGLVQSESLRLRDLETCRIEIEELETANLKEGEEEELFEEYSRLSNADELMQKVGHLTQVLNGEKNGVLGQLNRCRQTFESLAELAPTLKETVSSYNTVLIELDEIGHTLNKFESRIEHNPERAETLNTRLSLITRLKRKYAPSIEEINAYLAESHKKLYHLENADIQIAELQKELEILAQKNHAWANTLTNHRKNAAIKFQKEIVEHLQALNMPKVEFFADITPHKRSRSGDDKVEFFLIPNVGEHRVSVRECASGGELSRTMLAIQAVLTGKENIPTIVFDEIDANIGGETASVVGEKMAEIGQEHQVLCITHFPQVAKHADHHLRISKHEIDGRTLTIVDSLNEITRQHELLRMHGG